MPSANIVGAFVRNQSLYPLITLFTLNDKKMVSQITVFGANAFQTLLWANEDLQCATLVFFAILEIQFNKQEIDRQNPVHPIYDPHAEKQSNYILPRTAVRSLANHGSWHQTGNEVVVSNATFEVKKVENIRFITIHKRL